MRTNEHPRGPSYVRAKLSEVKHREFCVKLRENGDTQQAILSRAVEAYVDGRDTAGDIAAIPSVIRGGA